MYHLYFHRGPVGQPGVSSFTRDFDRWMKEGCGNGASLSVGALLGEPAGGGSFTKDSERRMTEGSGNGVFLSVWSCVRGTWRGGKVPLLGALKVMYRKALETGISLHRGPAGKHGWGLMYQGLWKMNEGGLWKQSISVCGCSMRGTWREDFFTGDPEGYAK
jgi:hypothetical protein